MIMTDDGGDRACTDALCLDRRKLMERKGREFKGSCIFHLDTNRGGK